MKKIFQLINETVLVFGLLMLVFFILSLAIGDSAKEASSLFVYGSDSISLAAIFQLLMLSLCVTILNAAVNSNFMIKIMPRIPRLIILFVLIFMILVFMILKFQWFSADQQLPWVLTAIAFVFSFTASTVTVFLKEKEENKKMTEALNSFQISAK